jgi:hypothetical protein
VGTLAPKPPYYSRKDGPRTLKTFTLLEEGRRTNTFYRDGPLLKTYPLKTRIVKQSHVYSK